MIFSNQHAGIIGMKVTANPLALPEDPSFAVVSGGTVVSGGISLGGGKFRRNGPVMVVEVPVSGPSRLRFASAEDASAKIAVVSLGNSSVSSGAITCSAYAYDSSGTSLNWTPFVAGKTMTHSPVTLQNGVGEVVSGSPLVAHQAPGTARAAANNVASTIYSRINATELLFGSPPPGQYLGIALDQGRLFSIPSDVQSKLLNVSAMAAHGTSLSMYGIFGNNQAIYAGSYYGDAISRAYSSARCNAPAIEKYPASSRFSTLTPTPGTVWIVIAGDASTDLITIQKGI